MQDCNKPIANTQQQQQQQQQQTVQSLYMNILYMIGAILLTCVVEYRMYCKYCSAQKHVNDAIKCKSTTQLSTVELTICKKIIQLIAVVNREILLSIVIQEMLFKNYVDRCSIFVQPQTK